MARDFPDVTYHPSDIDVQPADNESVRKWFFRIIEPLEPGQYIDLGAYDFAKLRAYLTIYSQRTGKAFQTLRKFPDGGLRIFRR